MPLPACGRERRSEKGTRSEEGGVPQSGLLLHRRRLKPPGSTCVNMQNCWVAMHGIGL